MESEKLEEQIKSIILKHIKEAFDNFENYIYKEKYKEAALEKGFYPTSEDFDVRKKLLNQYFQKAQKRITEIGSQAKPYLEEICEEADPIIREWAKEIIKNL